jgi:hypothetical protein
MPRERDGLSGGQRFVLFCAALFFGVLGVAAMFWSSNEAGSAVAVLLCGLLVFVAIQGTKVQRISAGDNSLDSWRRYGPT